MQCMIFHKNEVEDIYVPNESKTHGTFILYNLLSEIHAHLRYDFTSMKNEFILKYCNIYHDRYTYTSDYHDKLFWIGYFQKIGFQR